jgi:hypothetical protein
MVNCGLNQIRNLNPRMILLIIMVVQISEMNGFIIMWLSAIEIVFDNAWYKYEIIWYCV